jgi:hypothetical protein
MSSELERRLEGMLAAAPEPDAGAGEEALHRALRALRPAAAPHRGLRTAVLVFAAAAVLLAIAAGSLAGAGALHVSFGQKAKKHHPVTTQLSLPKGANGIAAIVDGRLSVVIKGGFRLQGLRVTAAALSPHALFVAAGIGHSLVAIAPNGRRPWTHPAGGKVVAIAWAPDGLQIAYVVHTGHGLALHLIYGNGRKDTTIDRSVRAVRPSWRADSLAVAYVGAGGKAIVYDVGHTSRIVASSTSPVTHVVFGTLAKVSLVGEGVRRVVARGDVEAIGWQQDDRLEVAVEMGVTPALVRTFGRSGQSDGGFRVPGRVVGLTSGFVVTRTQGRLLAGWREKRVFTVLTVADATPVGELAIG